MTINNPAIYDSVLAGIAASNGAWLQDTVASDYQNEVNAAEIIAREVDQSIPPIIGGISISQRQLLVSIVKGVMTGRAISSTNPSDYTLVAKAIVAMFTEYSISLTDADSMVVSKTSISIPRALGSYTKELYAVPSGKVALLTPPILDVTTAPTINRTITVQVGQSTNPDSLLVSEAVTSSTPVGNIGGIAVNSFGADSSVDNGYVVRYPAGTILDLTISVGSPAGCLSLFGGATPAGAVHTLTFAVTSGLVFRSSVATTVVGAAFYKDISCTGTHIAELWSITGVLLASATYTNETASGWQYVAYPVPVSIAADTLYEQSIYYPGGHPWQGPNLFNAAITNGTLTGVAQSEHLNNVYLAGHLFPTSDSGGTNFGVDVLTALAGTTDGSLAIDLAIKLLDRA